MKTIALIERGKDGTFGIYTPNLECATISGNGNTLAEAKSDFIEAYDNVKLAFQDIGKPVPEELIDLEFDYQYDTASALVEFSFINLTALAKEIGINTSLMHQYKAGQYISSAQAEKIQLGINRMGERMAAFRMI